ncbi:(2Fe-2S)-binding protein [Kibdelosporangium lantanae]
MSEVPATRILDREWLSTQLDLATRRYPKASRTTLGVLWWYSASMVVLGPAVAGEDPALESITLVTHPDGRLLDARSRPDTGGSLRDMLSACIGSVSAVSGARERTLWAITTDSLANRLLWAGRAGEVVDAGPELPTPRYVTVDGRVFVRRVSCCLVYQGTDVGKCVSCPRQTPAERLARLRLAP